MVRSLRGLFLVLVAAALTCAAGSVFAQAAPNLPVPVHAAAQYASPSGLQSTVTFDARGLGGAANAGHYSRPVLVSNNTLGGLGRGLAKRTLPSLAFLAALEAAGWAIDELTQQVQSDPGEQGTPITPGADYYSTMIGSQTKYFASLSSAEAALVAYHNSSQPDWFQVSGLTVVQTYSDQWRMTAAKDTPYGYASVGYLVAGHTNAPSGMSEEGRDPVVATDAEIANFIKANPSVWNDAIHNADGSVNRNPDVMAASQALAAELANADPAQQPGSDQGWDSGQQYGDEPAPSTASDSVFCEWATKVCDFIDWMREPLLEDEDDTYEIPVVDPFENMPTWNSGLGAGSCPAPRSVETFVGTIEIPFDVFCELAELMRGLVLAAAYASAAFILLGVKRG